MEAQMELDLLGWVEDSVAAVRQVAAHAAVVLTAQQAMSACRRTVDT